MLPSTESDLLPDCLSLATREQQESIEVRPGMVYMASRVPAPGSVKFAGPGQALIIASTV